MRIEFTSSNPKVIYDRRPNHVALSAPNAESCGGLEGKLTYCSRSGLSGHWDVRLPFGVEVLDAYRVSTHHVEGLHAPDSGTHIVMPPQEECYHLPAIRLGGVPAIAWLPYAGPDEWRPSPAQLFEESVEVEFCLTVLGADVPFSVRVCGRHLDSDIAAKYVRRLPRNLKVRLAELSQQWGPEYSAYSYDQPHGVRCEQRVTSDVQRFGLELAGNGAVFRVRLGVRTHVVESPSTLGDDTAADAWEQYLPDGCSDVTGLALGTEGAPWAAVRVLIAPDQCVALAYIDGEWWDYHCYTVSSDPAIAAKAALRGLVEKYESQSAQRQTMAAARAELDAWIAAHPDVEVTIEDSLRVRHCRPGTEQFRDQHFPGRESVTVAELAPLAASDERVRLVLAGVMSRAALQVAS